MPETQVPRARFPVIDFHTHLSWSARRRQVTEAHNNATPEEVLPVMDRKNLRMMVNLTGGYGKVLEQTINYWQKPHPRQVHRFYGAHGSKRLPSRATRSFRQIKLFARRPSARAA